MADVRKLELVNKRMFVADGVFGQTDAILGGFTDDLTKTLKEFQTRTKAQIDAEYEETLSQYEEENRRDVEAAEQVLFTTFTSELAKKVKITPKYADERIEKVNSDLWELVKYFFMEYNENHTDCYFVINEEDKTVKATDKNALEHTLQDLRTAITDVEKQLEAESSDRMARLTLSRKLGEAKNNLMQKEESIYFDAMRIDLACEEDIKKFLEREQINARLMRHFELEITGRS